MRVAIISDIHANLTALEAVIADWGVVDAVWCLGDIVGYGPDPGACIDRVRSVAALSIPGNHDLAAIGRLDLSEFNDLAAEAAEWTGEQLSAAEKEYLDELPDTRSIGEFFLAHGSPRDPIWEYVVTAQQALDNFAFFEGAACFVGHSHVPLSYTLGLTKDVESAELRRESPDYLLPTDLGLKRHLINVGSVGQPRDGDPRARYVILDTDARRYWRRRVAYDVLETQGRMRRAGLPRPLWQRLAVGQ